MTDTPHYWTDERVAELKRHHEAGLSARQIGVEIGATRNAVIGKLKRLGMLGKGVSRPRLSEEDRKLRRQELERNRGPRQRNRGTKMQDMPTPPPPFVGSLNIPFGDLRPFRNHSPNQCRYIAAEPPGPDYLACGNETLVGESYCGHCSGIVFNRGQVYVARIQEAA